MRLKLVRRESSSIPLEKIASRDQWSRSAPERSADRS